jgi:hypothetical protein
LRARCREGALDGVQDLGSRRTGAEIVVDAGAQRVEHPLLRALRHEKDHARRRVAPAHGGGERQQRGEGLARGKQDQVRSGRVQAGEHRGVIGGVRDLETARADLVPEARGEQCAGIEDENRSSQELYPPEGDPE